MDSATKKTVVSGGKRLGEIKRALREAAVVGATFADIEALAQKLIREDGDIPSFSTVSGYDWATCIMKNDGICHGIPDETKIKDGDVVTIDVGLVRDGYHLDTTTTFAVGDVSADTKRFLSAGRQILNQAISRTRAGGTVYSISRVIERELQKRGYGAVYQLTGHGIGKELHMEPAIPCVARREDKKVKLSEGQMVAVEIMYTSGSPHLKVDSDGWTYRTEDGSLSGMFEETVLVTEQAPLILTK